MATTIMELANPKKHQEPFALENILLPRQLVFLLHAGATQQQLKAVPQRPVPAPPADPPERTAPQHQATTSLSSSVHVATRKFVVA